MWLVLTVIVIVVVILVGLEVDDRLSPRTWVDGERLVDHERPSSYVRRRRRLGNEPPGRTPLGQGLVGGVAPGLADTDAFNAGGEL